MIHKLKPKSEFSRNVLTLMTGTTIAQAIPIAISPILTRIYTPEDFGLFALFLSITSILSVVVTGRYELAIMLPKTDEDAINILALGFLLVCISFFILFILVILFNNTFTSVLQNEEIGAWLYFIPIIVFLIGIFNLLSYYNSRKQYYKDIADSTIIKSIVLAIIQIIIGLLKSGVAGLISGYIFSQMFANIRLVKNILNNKALLLKINKVKILSLMKRYKDFPKFSMWAILSNTLALHLINILISTFYTISILGFYSFTQKILGVPSMLIGNSIGQVFFQQATNEKQKQGNIINIFNNTLKKILPIGIIVFGFLFFIVEDLFAFVFSEKWRIAGTYAQIMMPLFFIRFIILPFMFIPSIFEKIKIDLYFQVGLLVNYIGIFFIGQIMDLSFINFLKIMVFVIMIYYLAYFILLNKMKYGK